MSNSTMRMLSIYAIFFGLLLRGEPVVGEERPRVPSDLVGLWTGSIVLANGDSWRIALAIVGGSSELAMGTLSLMSDNNACIHFLEIEKPAKKSKKGGSTISPTDHVLANTKGLESFKNYLPCPTGKFRIESSRFDRIIAEADWFGTWDKDVYLEEREARELREEAGEPPLEEDLDVIRDTWSLLLVRADDGSTSKTTNQEAALSPAAKLKARLACKESKGD